MPVVRSRHANVLVVSAALLRELSDAGIRDLQSAVAASRVVILSPQVERHGGQSAPVPMPADVVSPLDSPDRLLAVIPSRGAPE